MSEEITRALADSGPHTVESLAARLPDFSAEAIAAALDALAAAGVLKRLTTPEGEEQFQYTNPERYRLVDTPVVRQPGPQFGRR